MVCWTEEPGVTDLQRHRAEFEVFRLTDLSVLIDWAAD